MVLGGFRSFHVLVLMRQPSVRAVAPLVAIIAAEQKKRCTPTSAVGAPKRCRNLSGFCCF